MIKAYPARRSPRPQPLSSAWPLPQEGRQAATDRTTGSILVVEDEPDLADLIEWELTSATAPIPGFTIMNLL